MFFINLIFWLWAFIVPAGILSFFGWVLYLETNENLPFFIILTIIGSILGVWLAESIRKKHGLSHFFSRTMAAPDVADKNTVKSESENNPVKDK